MWENEEALSESERRSRYRCGKGFVTLAQIKPWSEYAAELQERTAQRRAEYEAHVKKEAEEKAAAEEKKRLEREAAKRAEEEAAAAAKAAAGESATEEPKKAEESTAAAPEAVAAPAVPEAAAAPAFVPRPVERTGYGARPGSFAPRIEAPPEPLPAVFPPDEELNNIVSLWRGDITSMEIDGIVNAANQSLLGGGGIDGAIHRAAGDDLYFECKQLNGCHTGGCKISRGYNLPAKFVLHTVGPVGEYPKKLVACYRNCLRVAVKNNVRSIAFCGISTGIYGYPLVPASRVAIQVIREWLAEGDNRKHFDRIIFCVFLAKELDCYEQLLPSYFPLPGTPFSGEGPAALPEYTAETDESDESDESSEDDEDTPQQDTKQQPTTTLLSNAQGEAGTLVAAAVTNSNNDDTTTGDVSVETVDKVKVTDEAAREATAAAGGLSALLAAGGVGAQMSELVSQSAAAAGGFDDASSDDDKTA